MWGRPKPEQLPRTRLADLEDEVRRLRLSYQELEDKVLHWMRRQRGREDRAAAVEPEPNEAVARVLARRMRRGGLDGGS